MNLSRRESVAVIILLSIAVTIFLYPLTQAVPKPSPNLALDDFPSTYSYVIKTDGLGVYWMTDSTGHETFWSDNQTLVEQYALGNLTSGTLFLMQVQHNSSLTVPANILVIQDYQGKLTYFTSTGSVSPTDCPVATEDTFTLTSDTTEHTIVTLTPTSTTQMMNFYLDLSALTQNCTLRVYYTIGAGFVEMTGMTEEVAAGSHGMPLKDHVIDKPWKLTIQSTVAEGASRDIPYEYFVNVY